MKTFEEFLNEGVQLDPGVTLVKDKTHNSVFQHKGEMKKRVKHDIHFNGKKIGHMETYSHAHHKKAKNSRLIASTTYKIHHMGHYSGGAGFMRSSNSESKEHLANMMARDHDRMVNKD